MKDLRAHWQQTIESRQDYEYPSYTLSDWKREVFDGKTRRGYAEIVSDRLMSRRPMLPEVLRQFKPKGNFGKAVKEAVVEEFEREGYIQVVNAKGHGWFAMSYAFENLIPFIVARVDASFVTGKATSENRADLRELAAEVLYEWDGCVVPRYEEL